MTVVTSDDMRQPDAGTGDGMSDEEQEQDKPDSMKPPAGGSKVSPETQGPPINPPSQGVPTNPAQPRH